MRTANFTTERSVLDVLDWSFHLCWHVLRFINCEGILIASTLPCNLIERNLHIVFNTPYTSSAFIFQASLSLQYQWCDTFCTITSHVNLKQCPEMVTFVIGLDQASASIPQESLVVLFFSLSLSRHVHSNYRTTWSSSLVLYEPRT